MKETTAVRGAMTPGPLAMTTAAGFAPLLRAEWTKFRTVRGWLAGMAAAAAVMVLLGLAVSAGDQFGCPPGPGCPPVHPTGPGGEAVTDSFYFVHQPLGASGSITAAVTSLTGMIPGNAAAGNPGAPQAHPAGGPPPRPARRGSQPWAKAGIIIKADTSQGSAYAAMLVTPAHGVRFQFDYTGDTAGLPGAVGAASPRWLRLTRSGAVVTGYDSADGTHWLKVGAVILESLPATAAAGLFAASPAYTQTFNQHLGGSSGATSPTLATATFGHVRLDGRPGGAWSGYQVGGTAGPGYPVAAGGFRRSGDTFTVSGSGDIAPDELSGSGNGAGIEHTLSGAFAGLIAVIVVAAMFITAEYRRGLIRVTLTASPQRGRVLAAKAIVIAGVTFAAGLAAGLVAVPLGERLLRASGMYVYPVTTLTQVRVVAGTAALLAVVAVSALAAGTMLRRSAVAITAVVTSIVIPYILAVAMVLPAGAAAWLLRVTPAAGFAIQQSIPRYPQASGVCTPSDGCFPLAPWTGFAVLGGYAALALALAALRLRRADA